MNKNLALEERVSFVNSITKDDNAKDGFKDANTPLDLEDGALREGGALNYWSPEILTIIFQYFVIGLTMGGINGMRYPVLNVYFQLDSATLNAAGGLMTLGWSFKVFYGMVSDCFPIMGYSRKPYIMLGWILTAICLIIIAIKPVGDHITETSTKEEMATAQSNGSLLALLCAAACFCYIMTVVSCDALVVENAQREPENVRGRLQSTIYAVRFISQGLIRVVNGVFMNSERYGGTFSFDISVNLFFWILAVPVIGNIVLVYFFLKDRKRERVNVGAYLSGVYQLIQQRAVWQVMIFCFMFNLFASGISSLAGYYIQLYWAKVENINNQMAFIVTNFIFGGTLLVMGKWGTNWNWRWVLVVTTLTASAIDAFCQFLTIYDVVRSQWFYLGIPLTTNIPLGIQFVVTTYVIVELAGDGNEGLTYGLLTTVSNLPSVFGTMITNVFSTQLLVGKSDIKSDTPQVRNHAAYSYLIVYATTIIACMWTLVLPPQKAAVKELFRTGGKYPKVGTAIILVIFVVLCLSVTSNMMSMFESTACQLLAGGSGCE